MLAFIIAAIFSVIMWTACVVVDTLDAITIVISIVTNTDSINMTTPFIVDNRDDVQDGGGDKGGHGEVGDCRRRR